MVTTDFDLVFEALAVAGGLVLLWVYGWDNAWWRSRVGRALMLLAAAIVLILGLGITRRLVGLPGWTQAAELGLVVCVVVSLDVAFIRERREWRRRELARKDHRIERSETS
jgi:hypothetical protein